MPDQTPDDAQNLMTLLGRNVRWRRKRASLTQKQLAEHVNMHWRHVEKGEMGEVNVTLQTIIRIASALRTDARGLLGRTSAKVKTGVRTRTP